MLDLLQIPRLIFEYIIKFQRSHIVSRHLEHVIFLLSRLGNVDLIVCM